MNNGAVVRLIGTDELDDLLKLYRHLTPEDAPVDDQ